MDQSKGRAAQDGIRVPGPLLYSRVAREMGIEHCSLRFVVAVMASGTDAQSYHEDPEKCHQRIKEVMKGWSD